MTATDVKKELMEWVSSILIAIILAFIIRFFVFEFIQVLGSSMEPTLNDHDWLVVEKLSFRFRAPKTGDIIILKNPENLKENFVKRVIATENDEIEVKGGYVYLNGVKMEEAYIKQKPSEDYPKVKVPKDAFFVMGDNRNGSKDSRYPTVGFIPKGDLLGRAVLRIWPIQHFRWLGGK